MAHLTNFNRKTIHGVLEHNGRAPEDDVERKNTNIDPKRTPKNYAIRHDGLVVGSDELKTVRAAVRKAIYKEIKRTDKKRRAAGRPKLRKDAAVASSWVVPLPADWPESVDEQVFFKYVMAFIKKRYKNGVSFGFVHMDETHPHMHVIVVPLDKDGCISKKDVFTRADLRTFHDDFQKYMDEQLDFHATVRLDEDDLAGRAKSKLNEDEKFALEADTEATIEDRVEEQVASERAEIRSKASELAEWEEDLAEGENDLKRRLRNAEAQAEDVINRQMTAEALERANAEKWDAIVKESRKLKDERQAFEKEKSDFKDEKQAFKDEKDDFEYEKKAFRKKKKDLVRREENVTKREDNVARRETAVEGRFKQLKTWWKKILYWLDEQLTVARLEEAKRQAEEKTSVVVKALDEFEYESHEDESMDTFAR